MVLGKKNAAEIKNVIMGHNEQFHDNNAKNLNI